MGALAAVLLPWLAGFALLSLAGPRASTLNRPVLLGYGYVLGLLLTSLILRALSALGIDFSLLLPALVLSAITLAAGGWGYYANGRVFGFNRPALKFELATWDWVVVVLLAVIGLRIVTVGIGNTVQPLLGADTWWFWASKARVWYETGEMTPFVGMRAWINMSHAGELVYSDPQPRYPVLVPLSKTWVALAMGRWDEAVTNLPWLGLYVALLIAFYGQLREITGTRYAVLGTVLLAGLPMLDTNVFAAGLADLFVGVGFTLAAMALYQFTRSRDNWQLLLLGVGAAFFLGAKQVGALWMVCLIPGLAIALAPRRWWWPLLGLGVILTVLGVFIFAQSDMRFFGYGWERLRPSFRADSAGGFAEALFVEEAWHLLWFATPIGVVMAALRRRLTPADLALTLVLASTLVVLVGIFLFTGFSGRYQGMLSLQRHLLHVAPAVMFLCAVVWSRLVQPASRE